MCGTNGTCRNDESKRLRWQLCYGPSPLMCHIALWIGRLPFDIAVRCHNPSPRDSMVLHASPFCHNTKTASCRLPTILGQKLYQQFNWCNFIRVSRFLINSIRAITWYALRILLFLYTVSLIIFRFTFLVLSSNQHGSMVEEKYILCETKRKQSILVWHSTKCQCWQFHEHNCCFFRLAINAFCSDCLHVTIVLFSFVWMSLAKKKSED